MQVTYHHLRSPFSQRVLQKGGMGSLGGLGIGVMSALLFLLLIVGELCYVFYWRKRKAMQKKMKMNVTTKMKKKKKKKKGMQLGGIQSYAQEAAFVGSFGGYPSSPCENGFISKFFSSRPTPLPHSSLSPPLANPPLSLHPSYTHNTMLSSTIEEDDNSEEEEEEKEKEKVREEERESQLSIMGSPSRLLFTIEEESGEELMELQEAAEENSSIIPISSCINKRTWITTTNTSSPSILELTPPSASVLSPFAALAVKPLMYSSPPLAPPAMANHHLVTSSSSSSSSSDTTPLFSPLHNGATSPLFISSHSLKHLFDRSPLQIIPTSSSSSSSSSSTLPIQYQPSSPSYLFPLKRGPLGILFQQPSPSSLSHSHSHCNRDESPNVNASLSPP